MTKKDQQDLVQKTASLANSTSGLTVDKINELAPAAQPIEDRQMTAKEKAKLEGARYIEPKRKLSPLGNLPEKLQKQHAYDWEYVKGVFRHEGMMSSYMTEPMEFWFSKYPGDHDCLWSIPPNVPCYVPRMIAMHLSGEREPVTGIECMKYHTFDYREKPSQTQRADGFIEEFTPITTNYRGKFSAVGAFN